MSKISRREILIGGAASALIGCGGDMKHKTGPSTFPATIEKFDRRLESVVLDDAPVNVLAEGFRWAEGPTWDPSRNCLYFTDVPQNIAYKWSEAAGLERFLVPSGIPNSEAEGTRELGANGLFWQSKDKLIVCNHGRRRVEYVNPTTLERTELFSSYEGKRFNSPNDVVVDRAGSIYFTDPPYGLDGQDNSPLKEMSVNGVYRWNESRGLERLFDDMTRPNGIALGVDGRSLYISQSDANDPYIRRACLSADGQIESEDRWFSALSLQASGAPGLPDGMAFAATGELFATGPGGVLIFSPEGELIGRINLGVATANCTFGGDGSTLFITSKDKLLSISTNVKGLFNWT